MAYGTESLRDGLVCNSLLYRHTGVVVFGREYYFGGMGIEWCYPVSML